MGLNRQPPPEQTLPARKGGLSRRPLKGSSTAVNPEEKLYRPERGIVSAVFWRSLNRGQSPGLALSAEKRGPSVNSEAARDSGPGVDSSRLVTGARKRATDPNQGVY